MDSEPVAPDAELIKDSEAHCGGWLCPHCRLMVPQHAPHDCGAQRAAVEAL